MDTHHDLLIIGGGTAGLTALREARRHTDRVRLINDGPVETTCIAAGCMPSKLLMHAARRFDMRRDMAELGIRGGEALTLDIPHALRHMRDLRRHFLDELARSIDELRPFIVDGRAVFATPTTLRVGDIRHHAPHILIATGSSPVIPEEYAAMQGSLLTSDTLFEQEDLPRRIGVIGMGQLGIDIAQTLAMMGIEVTAVQAEGPLGGLSDPDISRVIETCLRRRMTLWTGVAPQVACDGGRFRITADGASAEVDALFLSTGRAPRLHGMGLEEIGIALDDHGLPRHDPVTLKIDGHALWLLGDACNHGVVHRAADDAHRVVRRIFGEEATIGPCPVPLAIAFCEPNLATIGDPAAAMKDDACLRGEASFDDQGRAVVEQENTGLLRIYARADTGILVAAELAAPAGEHLAHLLALAIQHRLTAEQMLEMPFYHPTLTEAVRTALREVEDAMKRR